MSDKPLAQWYRTIIAPCTQEMTTAERGQAAVEYALIITLVSIVVIGALLLLGSAISDLFGTVSSELSELDIPQGAAASTPTPTPAPEPQPAPWEQWSEVVGRQWSRTDTDYCAGPLGEHRSFYGSEDWRDYEITVRATLFRGNGFGIYFRATQIKHANAYIFQYDPGFGGSFLYRRIVDGREQYPFAIARAPADYQWHNVEREIRIRVEGNTFTTYIDGEQVLQASHDEYTHGMVGLRTWHGAKACFHDFYITMLSPPGRDRDEQEEATPVPEEDFPRDGDDTLYDDFADGPQDGWQETPGSRWHCDEGMYCAGRWGEHRTFYGSDDWTNYVVTVQATLRYGKGFGIYFRATDIDRLNAYVFQYDPGYGGGHFLFRKVVNGREQPPFALAKAPADYQWHGVPRRVEVRVEGDSFTAIVDGGPVLQARDSTYPRGRIGLRVWSGSEACFDWVRVVPLAR